VKRTVRVLRRAQRDLQEIHDYVAIEAAPHASPLVEGLLEAIESLAQFSDRGVLPRDEALRQRGFRYLVRRQYLIFYKVLRAQVRVYRVVHGKRAYRDIL